MPEKRRQTADAMSERRVNRVPRRKRKAAAERVVSLANGMDHLFIMQLSCCSISVATDGYRYGGAVLRARNGHAAY